MILINFVYFNGLHIMCGYATGSLRSHVFTHLNVLFSDLSTREKQQQRRNISFLYSDCLVRLRGIKS